MGKTVHIQANTFIYMKSSIKKSTCYQRKVILIAKFVNQCKTVLYIKEMGGRFVGYLNPPEKKLQKNIIPMNRITNQNKIML